MPYKADQKLDKNDILGRSDCCAVEKNEFAQHDFYAYYPYDENAGQSHSAVTVSVPETQIQSAAGNMEHLSALDMLYAKREYARNARRKHRVRNSCTCSRCSNSRSTPTKAASPPTG
ncbi:MAG: fimbrillin family protein [Alistipes putredinis]|nr:MAG: fimbrillin family protein [Alistipes putredinis]